MAERPTGAKLVTTQSTQFPGKLDDPWKLDLPLCWSAARRSCGRERGLRLYAVDDASTNSWFGAPSAARLKAPVASRRNQNAMTKVDAMNRSARVPDFRLGEATADRVALAKAVA